jgi:hypothetical protein
VVGVYQLVTLLARRVHSYVKVGFGIHGSPLMLIVLMAV